MGVVYLISDTYNYFITPMRKKTYSFAYYTILKIQFWSVNYTLVAMICKDFEQNKPSWSGV